MNLTWVLSSRGSQCTYRAMSTEIDAEIELEAVIIPGEEEPGKLQTVAICARFEGKFECDRQVWGRVGGSFQAGVCGSQLHDGKWQGWVSGCGEKQKM